MSYFLELSGPVICGTAPLVLFVAGSLPVSPIVWDEPSGEAVPELEPDAAPISGTAPLTVPVAGSLPVSPIVWDEPFAEG